MWIGLFVIVLIGAVAYGYRHSKKGQEGKAPVDNALKPEEAELSNRVQELIQRGHSPERALAIARQER